MSLLGTAETAAETAIAVAVPEARLIKPILYALAGLLVIALLGFVVWWLVIRPRAAQVQAATAKVEAATATSTAGAAQDTVKIVTVHDRSIERINTITQGGVRAVQSAADAGMQVPAVAAAMRGSLCLYDTYRADPGCLALRSPGAIVGVASADAGSATPDR